MRPKGLTNNLVLSFYHIPECQHLSQGSSNTCLVGWFLWLPDSSYSRPPGSHMHSWIPTDCHNWRDSSWKATATGALQTQEPKTHPQLFCDKSHRKDCFWSFGLRGSLKVWHKSRSYSQGGTMKGHRSKCLSFCCIPSHQSSHVPP